MGKLFIPPVLVLISCILMVVFYFFFPQFNWVAFPLNLAGLIIAFCGFVIMGKARDLFKKHQTTLAIEESSFLITEGIFSGTRNPMYLGMFFLLLGTGICFRNIFSILTAFVFLALMGLIFIPKEEKLMSKSFGQDYLDYKKEVRKWI